MLRADRNIFVIPSTLHMKLNIAFSSLQLNTCRVISTNFEFDTWSVLIQPVNCGIYKISNILKFRKENSPQWFKT